MTGEITIDKQGIQGREAMEMQAGKDKCKEGGRDKYREEGRDKYKEKEIKEGHPKERRIV